MFRGTSAINLDAKGRIAIPSRYRDELDERSEGRLVITIDLNSPCLSIYPLSEWERVETQLSRLPSMREDVRRMTRLLVGNAVDVELDSAGRILIPQMLRAHARLNKHAVLAGQLHKFQLWDESEWNRTVAEDLSVVAAGQTDLPDELMNLVL